MYLIVSSIGIFVNNDPTTYDTSFSPSYKSRTEDIIFGNFYQFLALLLIVIDNEDLIRSKKKMYQTHILSN